MFLLLYGFGRQDSVLRCLYTAFFPGGRRCNCFRLCNRSLYTGCSFGRQSLNLASPYDLGKIFLGSEILKKLNLVKVPPDEIQLTKHLLKK